MMDSENEQSVADKVNICRVCGENGSYDLWEMHFRYNNQDIPLIEAFNIFSTLDNDFGDIHLCETCTESLTVAYTFWQRVKLSDQKCLIKLEKPSSKKEITKDKCIFENVEYIVESEDNAEDVEKTQQVANKNKKFKSTEAAQKSENQKKKPKYENNFSEILTSMTANKIGVNIALPHFIVTDSTFVDNTHDSNKMYDDDERETVNESNRKNVKTLTPSAFIPPDLNEINDFCMSPMESDGDGHSIYKCNHCLKAFAAPYHLMVHMRKSHICQYCWATFDKTNDLYDHVKESHKTFTCLLCNKEFQSNGNLRQHMRKNHSISLPAHISLLNVSEINLQ